MDIGFGESFVCACRGIFFGVAKDRNTKIHLAVATLAILVSVLLGISRIEFIIISMLCFFSIAMELFNNSIERFIDCIHPGYNKQLGIIKDMMAGMVLLVDFLAVTIGILIFYAPFINLLNINPRYPLIGLLIINILLLAISIFLHLSNKKD
jgi:undecaprenol kinase